MFVINLCHTSKSFLLCQAAKSVEIKCETRQGLYTLQQMCSKSEYLQMCSSFEVDFHFYSPTLPKNIFPASLGEPLSRMF